MKTLRVFRVLSKTGQKQGLSTDDVRAWHYVRQVELDSEIVWTCTCPGFPFKKRCRHIDAAREFAMSHPKDIVIEEQEPSGELAALLDEAANLLDTILGTAQ